MIVDYSQNCGTVARGRPPRIIPPSRCPSASDFVGSPEATFRIFSNSLADATLIVNSPSRMAPALKSMSSRMFLYVCGFAHNLMVGETTFPSADPRPVVNATI